MNASGGGLKTGRECGGAGICFHRFQNAPTIQLSSGRAKFELLLLPPFVASPGSLATPYHSSKQHRVTDRLQSSRPTERQSRQTVTPFQPRVRLPPFCPHRRVSLSQNISFRSRFSFCQQLPIYFYDAINTLCALSRTHTRTQTDIPFALFAWRVLFSRR